MMAQYGSTCIIHTGKTLVLQLSSMLLSHTIPCLYSLQCLEGFALVWTSVNGITSPAPSCCELQQEGSLTCPDMA
jgi:hypothetical protein